MVSDITLLRETSNVKKNKHFHEKSCRIQDPLRFELNSLECCFLVLFVSCPRVSPINSGTLYMDIGFVCVCVFFFKSHQQLQNVRTPTEFLFWIRIPKN